MRAWGPREPKLTTFSGRTALHLAACEGHLACVRWFKYDLKYYKLSISVSRFLLEVCEVEAEPRDRWGHTPLWDAQMFSRLWMKCFLSYYIQIIYIFIPSGRMWWVCWRSTSAWWGWPAMILRKRRLSRWPRYELDFIKSNQSGHIDEAYHLK